MRTRQSLVSSSFGAGWSFCGTPTNGVAVDDTLCLCLCGGHGGGGRSGTREGGEQTAKVRSYDCGGNGVVEAVGIILVILSLRNLLGYGIQYFLHICIRSCLREQHDVLDNRLT